MLKKLSIVLLLTICVLAVSGQAAFASTLDLIGVGWDKSNVTVLIKSKQATAASVADVEQAVADWNTAASGVGDAPFLQIVTGVRKADIVINMKPGGGAVLGQALPKTVSPFSPVLKSVSIQLSGKAFGENFSSAGTRNVARHELGHALGLGHSDDPDDLMYSTAESSEVFGNVDVLPSSCDVLGLDAIYPLPTSGPLPGSVTC